MKIKWVFRYTNYLLLIPAVGVIGYFKLSYWYSIISLLLVLISEIVIAQRKSKREKLINIAQNLKRLCDSFSIFVYSNRDNSIPSIFGALLANNVFMNAYGKGIKGWKLYLKEHTKHLFDDYNEFKSDLEIYIENPKGKRELSDIIRRFGKLVGSHYELHLNFLEIIKDTGISPNDFGQRYNDFKKEYDDFYSNLRGYTSDFEENAPNVFTGKYYFDWAKELPNVEFE